MILYTHPTHIADRMNTVFGMEAYSLCIIVLVETSSYDAYSYSNKQILTSGRSRVKKEDAEHLDNR